MTGWGVDQSPPLCVNISIKLLNFMEAKHGNTVYVVKQLIELVFAICTKLKLGLFLLKGKPLQDRHTS